VLRSVGVQREPQWRQVEVRFALNLSMPLYLQSRFRERVAEILRKVPEKVRGIFDGFGLKQVDPQCSQGNLNGVLHPSWHVLKSRN
jgi:hypothetical protein